MFQTIFHLKYNIHAHSLRMDKLYGFTIFSCITVVIWHNVKINYDWSNCSMYVEIFLAKTVNPSCASQMLIGNFGYSFANSSFNTEYITLLKEALWFIELSSRDAYKRYVQLYSRIIYMHIHFLHKKI